MNSATDIHEAIASLTLGIVCNPIPQSIVDIGCGTGSLLSMFKAKGVNEVLGVDGHWVAEDQLRIAKHEFMRHEFMRHDFEAAALKLPKRYCLAISTEVAEHLSSEHADAFVQALVDASDIILFSAAVPGQGGTNHVNEQWPSYWIEKFAAHGYMMFDCIRPALWSFSGNEWWYKQNLFLFCKEGKTSRLSIPNVSFPYDVIHPQAWQMRNYQMQQLMLNKK